MAIHRSAVQSPTHRPSSSNTSVQALAEQRPRVRGQFVRIAPKEGVLWWDPGITSARTDSSHIHQELTLPVHNCCTCLPAEEASNGANNADGAGASSRQQEAAAAAAAAPTGSVDGGGTAAAEPPDAATVQAATATAQGGAEYERHEVDDEDSLAAEPEAEEEEDDEDDESDGEEVEVAAPPAVLASSTRLPPALQQQQQLQQHPTPALDPAATKLRRQRTPRCQVGGHTGACPLSAVLPLCAGLEGCAIP